MRIVKYLLMAMFLLLLVPQLSFAAETPLAEADTVYEEGEVLYHQDFSEISDISFSGIKKGTASSELSSLVCDGTTLSINTSDDLRVYAILPQSEWTDSFTIEFDFSFREIAAKNGYVSVMLTSTGDEPENFTTVTFRANGTVDHFKEIPKKIADAMKKGETISVRVPVESGVLHEIVMTAGGVTTTIERETLVVVGSGNRGFAVRNASVDIGEVYIVNGTDYEEKTGYWADHSYIEDDKPVAPAPVQVEMATSPATGSSVTLSVALAAGSAMSAKKLRSNLK